MNRSWLPEGFPYTSISHSPGEKYKHTKVIVKLLYFIIEAMEFSSYPELFIITILFQRQVHVKAYQLQK